MVGGCGREPGVMTQVADSSADVTAGHEVHGWVDRVEGKPRIGGKVNVVGWAATEQPGRRIEEVEILLDGIEIGAAVEGVDRPDVADGFGKPAWNKSGWEAEVVLDKILPGEHRIEAVARDSGGARYPLNGARLITVLDSR